MSYHTIGYWRVQAEQAELEAFNALRDFIQNKDTSAERLLSMARDARRGQVILLREEAAFVEDAKALAEACGQEYVEKLERACGLEELRDWRVDS